MVANDWAGRRRELYEQALLQVETFRILARKRQQQSERDPAEPLLDSEQRTELKRLRRICRYDPSLALFFQIQVLRRQRRWSAALACLDNIPASDLIRPGLFTDRAELLGRLDRWNEARQVLDAALASDSSDARVHFGCARVSLHLGNFTVAARSALSGLELLDLEPWGHYLLGIALAGMRLYQQALFAFNRALAINPNFPQAHLWMARICRRSLADAQGAATHARAYSDLTNRREFPAVAPRSVVPAAPAPRPVAFAASSRDLPPLTDEVVIVSGLPRSGTSMLMQMLVAGGLTPLTDGLRRAGRRQSARLL